jgi:DNA-binding NarL/FixJ family response regulator
MRHGTGTAAAACRARTMDPVDVVVLLAPDRHGDFDMLLDAIAEVKQRDHTAVLVVFNRAVDADIVRRAANAGADFCVIEPSATELFSHIERARSAHRTNVEPGRYVSSAVRRSPRASTT